MHVSGEWRAALADEELRRAYPDPDFDDSGWHPITVPGHWQSEPPFAESDGPLLYRTTFSADSPSARRTWLRFEGLFYQADIWLDGTYLGDTEGYFAPHSFEVTDALAARSDHTLALELACSSPTDPTDRRNITGTIQPGGEGRWNPGGIWRPVVIDQSGLVAITSFRALCTEATAESATVTITATLDTATAVTVQLRTRAHGVEQVEELALAAGSNTRSWNVVVEQPDLWWPHSLGEPALTDLEVAVVVGAEDAVSDIRRLAIGLRKVELRSWALSVNGERIFLKGLVVDRSDDPVPVVEQAVHRGFDFIRLRGHIASPELYARADRLGLLVWQDLPLHGTYARGIRKQAARQAVAAVDCLGHHPSIAVWCGHDDPHGFDRPDGGGDLTRRLLAQQVPSWNTSVLDGSVKRALERADTSRPVVAHSGVLPHAGSGGTDTHLRLGRDVDTAFDVARLAARFPRLVRFVSDLSASDSGEAGRAVEVLRRLKYRPTGGVAVDADLAAAHEIRDAMAPVIVMADLPEVAYAPGDLIDLDVHVVSDLRAALAEAVVTATASWEGGRQEWSWSGDVGPDGCVRVGQIRLEAPPAEGAFVITLDLVHTGAKASNRYRTTIRRG